MQEINEKLEKYAKKLLKKYKEEFPYKYISTADVRKDFYNLKDLDKNEYIIVGEYCNKYDFTNKFKYPGITLFCIKPSRIGNKVSNKYFQKERMKASMGEHLSPIELWKNKKTRLRIFKGMIKLNKHKYEINEPQLRASIRLYYSVVPQFKVSVAKIIYDYFKAKNVLDFSSGWGDRLTGFYASNYTKSYIGIDPNTNLKPCYEKLIEELSCGYEIDDKVKNVNIYYERAENIKLNIPYKYDLIFTSPPYFELEKYTDLSTQSNIAYKNLQEWLDKFLFKTLNNHLPNLQGYLVLQISNYIKKSYTMNIIEPLMEFMKNKHSNFIYKGYIKVLSKGRFKNYISEPIFVWCNL